MSENPLGRPVRLLSLYPSFWPRQGGGQMVLAAIAQGLSPRVSNTVLTRRFHDTPAREEYEYVSVRRYPNPAPEAWKDYATGARPVSFPQKLVVTAFDIVCSLAPLYRLAVWSDLVHLHFPLPLGVSALMVRALVHRPLVITVHGNADVYELPAALTPVTRAVLTRADAVVSVSQDLADHLRQHMSVTNVTLIPNGIDVDDFRPGGTTAERLRLFSISRLVPRKNVHVLIAAVDALAKEGEAVSLVIAGTGPEQERIDRMARQSGGVVTFVGFIDEARKRELLSESDVFVQLSTREGLSIAALEALASGVPCLVSDIPGVREPITAGLTGWYVKDPEDLPSVIAALRVVLADRAKLGAMKRAARAAAQERYSLQAMCERYWTVYTDLLKGRA
jgi:glycosyltransferase involved in cell wall biosynthesis